jgi:hypothetical protein
VDRRVSVDIDDMPGKRDRLVVRRGKAVKIGSERADRGRLRRRIRWICAALVGAWLVLVVLLVRGAHADTVQGRSAVERARHQSIQELVDGHAADDLRRGQVLFGRAGRRLRSPALLPIRLVPFVGRQLQSATSLARAAGTVAGAGADGIRSARAILQTPAPSGPARVDQVERFEALARSTDQRLAAVGFGPGHALVGPLARARRDLADEVGK